MIRIEKYTASWCSPCKMVETWLSKYNQTYNITRHDVQTLDGAKLADKNRARSLPTMIFYCNDIECNRMIGAGGERDFLKIIEDCKCQ